MLSFFGLSYSIYPFIVIGEMSMWDAAAAPEPLALLLAAAALQIPIIVAYSWFSYRVFRGKAQALAY